jgi:hypothetical protein
MLSVPILALHLPVTLLEQGFAVGPPWLHHQDYLVPQWEHSIIRMVSGSFWH